MTISTPDAARRGRPIWARHEGDRDFHGVSSAVTNASVTTFCRGRWPSGDKVEISESPPHHERCDECSRQMLEVRRVDRGLDELRDASSETFASSGEGG